MLSVLLLATLLQSSPAEPVRVPQVPTSSADERRIRAALAFFEHGPGFVGPHGNAETSLGGGSSSIAAAGSYSHPNLISYFVPGIPGVYNVILRNTGSGFQEQFLLQPATVAPGTSAPLLILFHGAGTSHYSGLFHTSFFTEAQQRGWHVLAPLGALQNNFGFLPGQINTRLAIAWTLNHLSVDADRVYGVGFSMGGGWALSQAARHLGSDDAHFAAILNHTGSVSLAHTYESDLGARPLLELRYGGTPLEETFGYRRCSTIDLDPASGTVGTDTDMVRNLRHVPIRNWMADMDPLTYLTAQTNALHGHAQAMLALESLTVVPASVHSWSTLDPVIACNWLAEHTYTPPAPATLATALIDQDGSYFDFVVQQDAPGAFSKFKWMYEPATAGNRLKLLETSNMTEIAVDATDLGLEYTGTLELELQVLDMTEDRIVLHGTPSAPVAVLRDGLPMSWTWFSESKGLTIVEPGLDTGSHVWSIEFP